MLYVSNADIVENLGGSVPVQTFLNFVSVATAGRGITQNVARISGPTKNGLKGLELEATCSFLRDHVASFDEIAEQRLRQRARPARIAIKAA